MSNSSKKNRSGYIGDPKLASRVRQYIRAHGQQSKYIDPVQIAEDLQAQYGEYTRKKKNAFVKSVEKVYLLVSQEKKGDNLSQLEDEYLRKKQKKIVKRSNGAADVSDSEDSFSENENYVHYENSNAVNSMMTSLYQNTPKSTPNKDLQRKGVHSIYPCDTTQNMDTSGIAKATGQASREDDCAMDAEEGSDIFFLDRDGNKGCASPAPSSQRGCSTEGTKRRNTDRKNEKLNMKKRKKDKDTTEAVKKGPEVQTSSVTFADVGGNEESLMEVCKLLVHLRHPEVYEQLGVTPPRGFLLHGPPGCGKTLLAHAIAGELGLPFIKMAATEIVSGVSGESEEKLRELFEKAVLTAPCILFLDEIDAITPKRETASKDMERRIVAQLLSCMDELSSKVDAHVLVIGATNRPDSMDPALRRAGRFDREICLGIPDENARKRILKVLCRNLKLSENFDFEHLAHNSPGFVGADLTALTREAAMTAVNRVFHELQSKVPLDKNFNTDRKCTDVSTETKTCDSSELPVHVPDSTQSCMSGLESVLCWLKEHPPLTPEQLEGLSISLQDFEEALKHVQPSAKREGFATIPDVTWEDIGALHAVREDLQIAILAPVRHPKEFHELGLSRAQGILLAGPPGCGKTLLAKAVANESGINFISVKGPELLNMYVGESERAVRQVFQRARNSSPCVIFFDELDALCPRRTDAGEGGASVRVVNQLLTEMDGLEDRKQVFIMGATNRPDIIDPAVLRPGRLDKTIYVGLPTAEDRLDILLTVTKKGTKPALSSDVCLQSIASDSRCTGFTGADLAALVREASVCALRTVINSTEDNKPSLVVTKQHFELAFTRVRPSVSPKEQQKYEKMKESLLIG